MTTTAPPRRLMPQNLDDWPALVMGSNPKPEQSEQITDELRNAFAVFNQRIATFATSDTRRVREAVRQAHFENDHAPYGSAACVILSGRPLSGKTHAALFCAFSETRATWSALPHDPNDPTRDRSIPWIYVEVPKEGRGHSVLKAMWTFCGAPPLPAHSANASDYLAALRRIAPRIGLRGIVIDDTHGVGARQSQESRLLADTMKTLVTGLPATLLFLGTGFTESGVLHGSAGDQVRLRGAQWIDVGRWDSPVRGQIGDWDNLSRELSQRLLLPSPRAQVRLTRRRVLERLVEGSGQRPGLATVWAKRAATYAAWHDVDLDLVALDATHGQLIEGRGA